MTPGSKPEGSDSRESEKDTDRPGQVTARAAAVLIALALGLLIVGWVLYGLIDMQRG